MNCYNIHDVVCSHNTNNRPAIADDQALNGMKSIINFFLRRFEPEDISQIFYNCWSDHEVWKWTSYAPMNSVDDVTIESFFEAEKQHADGTRVRVWNTDTLRGRMFVQFIALCYYEYLNEEIRKLKESLGTETGDPTHDTKEIIANELRLKSWLCNTPLYLQLQWFDTVESVDISIKLKNRRRTTEMTSRDALYLTKLGVPIR